MALVEFQFQLKIHATVHNSCRQVEFFLIQKMLHFRDHSAAPFSSLYLAREGHPNRNHYNISCSEVSDTIWGPLKEGKRKKLRSSATATQEKKAIDDTSAVRSLCGDIATVATDIRSRRCGF